MLMPKFCTPILSNTSIDFVETYFCPRLNGHTVYYLSKPSDRHQSTLRENRYQGADSMWVTMIKIASYFTIIMPVIILFARMIHRLIHQFKIEPLQISSSSAPASLEEHAAATPPPSPRALAPASLPVPSEHTAEAAAATPAPIADSLTVSPPAPAPVPSEHMVEVETATKVATPPPSPRAPAPAPAAPPTLVPALPLLPDLALSISSLERTAATVVAVATPSPLPSPRALALAPALPLPPTPAPAPALDFLASPEPAAAAAAAAAAEMPVQAAEYRTIASLMESYTEAWRPERGEWGEFEPALLPTFNLEHFNGLLADQQRFAKPDMDSELHFGFIERVDVEEGAQVYMRADLHGDLKSLIENLKTLQKEGILDENFKCCPGKYIAFLGDYCDRGIYGTEILEILMTLRNENPKQVILIRGNHESITSHNVYGATDEKLTQVITNERAKQNLSKCYNTMPLGVYMGVTGGKLVFLSHGLFEVTVDPHKLLDADAPGYMLISIKRQLSERIQRLAASGNAPLAQAAARILTVAQWTLAGWAADSELIGVEPRTAYNWGDIKDNSNFGSLSVRQYSLDISTVQDYLKISSSEHREVVHLFRGHQHEFCIHKVGQVAVATTLSVGANTPAAKNKHILPDCVYIVTMHREDFSTRSMTRHKHSNETDVTRVSQPLTEVESFIPFFLRRPA